MLIRPSRTSVISVFYLIVAAVCVLPALGMDANFTTARFAFNLTAGRGLVFYSPAPTITTYPLIPIAFTLNAHDPLWMAWAISALAAAAGGLILARLVGRGWWVGVAYILAAGLSPSAVTLSLIALALAATLAAIAKRWLIAGLLIALAVLTDPLAVILLLLLVLYSVREGDLRWRFLLPAIVVPGLILGAQILSLGGPGSVILAAPQSQLIVIAMPILAILALFQSRHSLQEHPHLALLVAWSATAGWISMIGNGWPSAVILPGVVILIALWGGISPHPKSLPHKGSGAEDSLTLNPSPTDGRGTKGGFTPLAKLLGEATRGVVNFRLLILLALAADLALNLLVPTSPLAPSLAKRQASVPQIGAWITAHTDANGSVAVAFPGVLPFDLDRPVLELPGSMDGAFFIRYAPGALVVAPDMTVTWPGFPTTYIRATSIGDAAIYVPVVRFAPLDSHDVDVIYAANLGREDLRLRGVGITNTIRPNDRLRIRLDWDLAYTPSFEATIRLQLQDAQGRSVAQGQDKLPAATWHPGQLSTYHLLVVPGNVQGDQLALHVGVSVRGGDLGDHQVTVSDFLNEP